jgi:hypothetical protein
VALGHPIQHQATHFNSRLISSGAGAPCAAGDEDWACGSTATTAMVWSDKIAIANGTFQPHRAQPVSDGVSPLECVLVQ